MKNKFLSLFSLGLTICIMIQFLYFYKQFLVDKDTSSLVISEPYTGPNLSTIDERKRVTTMWSFSDGKPVSINEVEKIPSNTIHVERNKIAKPVPPPIQNVQFVPQTLPTELPVTHNIRYLGLADSNNKLTLFFDIEGSYITLKQGETYNNLKLNSINDSNIIFVDLQSQKDYVISK